MESVIGGMLIGAAVSIMLLFNGRITGISGIVSGLLDTKTLDKNWRILFLLGLIIGGFVFKLVHPQSFTLISNAKTMDFIIAGFLVGFGTLMGNGCTSGHGVCGISRMSIRSITATVSFIAAGAVSVVLFKLLRGSL
ncbi:MAG: YeeE/YedE family protein [Bacteriovoracaceae bacterium]|nr:YeeE/YedE family protein [Bacteriovoracaceae bacterium]